MTKGNKDKNPPSGSKNAPAAPDAKAAAKPYSFGKMERVSLSSAAVRAVLLAIT